MIEARSTRRAVLQHALLLVCRATQPAHRLGGFGFWVWVVVLVMWKFEICGFWPSHRQFPAPPRTGHGHGPGPRPTSTRLRPHLSLDPTPRIMPPQPPAHRARRRAALLCVNRQLQITEDRRFCAGCAALLLAISWGQSGGAMCVYVSRIRI